MLEQHVRLFDNPSDGWKLDVARSLDSPATSSARGSNIDINDPFASSIELTFDNVGPYMELLGYGENPTSPIALDTSAWDRVKESLGSLEFDSDISVDDTQSVSTVRYDVKTGRMPASSLLSGVGMAYELQMARATREDLGQAIIVEDWGIEFVDGSPGALNGTIEFRVEGDAFDYFGSLTYADESLHDEYRQPRAWSVALAGDKGYRAALKLGGMVKLAFIYRCLRLSGG